MSTVDDAAIVSVGAPFPRIAKIQALDGYRVLATWADGRQEAVDLAPVIFGFKVYAPLRGDRARFENVHVASPSVVAWGEDGAIDMHVSQIERLAEEAMDGTSFQAFLSETGLTRDAAAAMLGISRRMVGYYAKDMRIPRYIALACAQVREQMKKPDHQRGARTSSTA